MAVAIRGGHGGGSGVLNGRERGGWGNRRGICDSSGINVGFIGPRMVMVIAAKAGSRR